MTAGRSREELKRIGWKKGQSGNPGGRPKSLAEFTDRARALSEGGLDKLRAMALDADEDSAVRIRAWQLLLAYSWGRPPQLVAIQHNSGASVSFADLMARRVAVEEAESRVNAKIAELNKKLAALGESPIEPIEPIEPLPLLAPPEVPDRGEGVSPPPVLDPAELTDGKP
jgi:hypothetical protein